MLVRLVSVSEECRADSGVSGPGAGRRLSGELVRTRTKVFCEGGRQDEGAGRNREHGRFQHCNFPAVVCRSELRQQQTVIICSRLCRGGPTGRTVLRTLEKFVN